MKVNGHAARIHPIVPPTRTKPNSFCASFIFAKAIEFAIEIVGTYTRQWRNISKQNGPNDRVKASPKIAAPPIKWLKDINFSAEKWRSAYWVLKNIPTTAAMGKALRIQDCCPGLNPRLGK